jgi:hypothetical protein
MSSFLTKNVIFMPIQFEPGILYVSRKYEVAVHLCACGCGSRVITPLGSTDWRFRDSPRGPSLWPSIGNWQLPCRSHYVIRNGEVLWAEDWTDEEIKRGRSIAQIRTDAYFERKYARRGLLARLCSWFSGRPE